MFMFFSDITIMYILYNANRHKVSQTTNTVINLDNTYLLTYSVSVLSVPIINCQCSIQKKYKNEM